MTLLGASMCIYEVLVRAIVSSSTVGLMDGALAAHLGVLGSIPGMVYEPLSKIANFLFISRY